MRRRPGQVDQLFLDWGTTGVAASLGVRVLDNEGATTIARATGFTEYPAGSGLYYLDDFEFPDERGSYTLLYDDDAGTAAPGHTATEDLEVTSSAGEPFDGDTYATTTELFRILKISTPSADQTTAAERVLGAATFKIDKEVDRTDDDPLVGAEVLTAQTVCLDYAAELWKLQEVQFGLIGINSEFGPTRLARDLWEKHAIALEHLKGQWGLA